MISFAHGDNSASAAATLDQKDECPSLREHFVLPSNCLYFVGHSLGPMPKTSETAVKEELAFWGQYGVEGHFEAKRPWYSYHENITESFARLVGAKPSEVVAMNGLTVNLHLMMVSFYRPTSKRYKILIENNTFPSDKYAVDSQARFHGFDPQSAVVELESSSEEDILNQIEALGDSLALVMLGNCNYLSGQYFDMPSIAKKSHRVGALCGFNLAHGAGNLEMKLHDWNVDFAVWCSYKYLNAGPGGIAGAFVHQRHIQSPDTLPRFEGWWGSDKKTRFQMKPQFEPIKSVEAWQLSNPPIFQLASLMASLKLFDQIGIKALRARGDRLTAYLEWLLKKNCPNTVKVITPSCARGSMLSVKARINVKDFKRKGILVDFREPDVLRMTPAPLYNTFSEVYELVEHIRELTGE